MSLRQLYQVSTASANPSSLTNLQPGGAGVQVSGTTTNPGISAPYIEQIVREVLDITAPTLITQGVTQGTPAPAGKLLVWDPYNTAFGAGWKLSSIKSQSLGSGTFGVVYKQGDPTQAGPATSSVNGNIAATSNARAQVVIEGPVSAFINTTVNATAISAGMPLSADGAGNLTYAGASPAAGSVVAIAAGNVAASTSVPVLTNVYVGGF